MQTLNNQNPAREYTELPADLLRAVAAPGGGRVVLVLGAGCSHEDPTGLPLARPLATECHRQLLADGILQEGEVDNPSDLSAIADAVFAATGSQRELVERFPPDRFRHAEPNEGYIIAAALLQEGAVSDILTLNFDVAATAALAQLGTQQLVSTIRGPEDHRRLGTRNLIYLHRDINSEPDTLILRSTALQNAWREGWEEVVARRVLSGAVTVFIGLGSPAGVLIETATRILSALEGSGGTAYVVDVSEPGDSTFLDALGLSPTSYVQLGWGAFMDQLARRLVEEHRAAIASACVTLSNELGLDQEDIRGFSGRLVQLGLIGLGRLRSSWLLETRSYVPHNSAQVPLLCDLLLTIAMIERTTGLRARFEEDGIVRFEAEGRTVELLVCTGCGWRDLAWLEARLSVKRQRLIIRGKRPVAAIATGVSTATVQIATPSDITGNAHPADLTRGTAEFRIFLGADLRQQPELVSEVVA